MKKMILASALILTSSFAFAKQKQIVVVVIDTGISKALEKSPMLCKSGHLDFTNQAAFPYDTHGHGSHISGLIDQFVKGFDFTRSMASKVDRGEVNKMVETKANYCQIILKYYDENASAELNTTRMLGALRLAVALKPDFINISGGGQQFIGEESALVKKALDSGIVMVTAAGNDGYELDHLVKIEGIGMVRYDYYPAGYDGRNVVVGNLHNYVRAKTSNFGHKVNAWEEGTSRLSFLKSGDIGYMTGTSQATAIKTGKLIKKRLSN